MSNETIKNGRRQALKLALGGVIAIPLSNVLATRGLAADEGKPHLSPDDPTAKALNYVNDASKADRPDKGGTPGKKQFCHSCQFVKADKGEWRPCAIFPGHLVHKDGWCTSWTAKA